jgi:hypothetical protein
MAEKKIQIAKVNLIFARVIKVITLAGLAVMTLFGLLYLFGLNAYLNIYSVIEHWEKPVTQFWSAVKGTEVNDYSWFLFSLNKADSLSMLGVALLTFTPLIGILAIIPRTKKLFLFLLCILVVEFVFSILRPFLW